MARRSGGVLGELKRCPLYQDGRILAGLPIPLIPGPRKFPALFTPTPDGGSPMKLQVQAASIAVGDCIGSHPIAQIGFPIAVVAEGRPIDRVMCARGAVLPGTEGGVTNLIRRAPHAWI